MALTAERVINKVEKVVQDTSFTLDEDYIPWINECIDFVAGRVLLPDLQTTVELTADSTGEVNIPLDFHRMLYYCFNKTANIEAKIYQNTAQLFQQFPNMDSSGNINSVALLGTVLYYMPKPTSAQTLHIQYYKKHVDISSETEEIKALPLYIAPQLLHYYLCYKCYEMIEDGVEGEKINTKYYLAQFNTTVEQFKKEFQPAHEPLATPTTDVINFEVYM